VTGFSRANAPWRGTVLARWDAGPTDPWRIRTDLAPAQAAVAWYGLRPMIACGGKATKRGGGHGEQIPMTAPARAIRRWFAIAVATVWVIRVGGHAETTAQARMRDGRPEPVARPTLRARPRLRPCVAFGVASSSSSPPGL
jgi:hypothetical protein